MNKLPKQAKIIIVVVIIAIILMIITKGDIFPLILLFLIFSPALKRKYKEIFKKFENINPNEKKEDNKEEKSQESKDFNYKDTYEQNNFNFNNKTMENIKNVMSASAIKVRNIVIGVIGVIVGIVVLVNIIIVIEAGQTGVFSLFGKVKDRELSSGIHIVNPLGKVTRMSIRTEEYTMSVAQGEGQKYGDDAIKALTSEGLNIDLDITVLYKLKEDEASEVYRTVGTKYNEKIIRPAIRSTIREVIARYSSKDIYSQKRGEVTVEIETQLREILSERGIDLENVLLRNVELPPNLAKAIQEKLQAEQEAQKYDFVLEKEKKEKERKIIEAEGQRDAQTIINESLSDKYLNYLYIQGLKDREGTIYVPTNPQTGLPVFVQGQ